MTMSEPTPPDSNALFDDAILSRAELAELTGIPIDQIADTFDPEDNEP
jgi:hypothetical protein